MKLYVFNTIIISKTIKKFKGICIVFLFVSFCGVAQTPTPFITTWQTDASTNVTIPLTGSGYDFDIDWGDGTIETKTGTPGDISHTYATAGIKTVSIRPNITTGFPRIYVNQFTNKDLLLTVENWGSGTWGSSVNSSFYGASNLEVNATDTPDFSQTMGFSNMFRSCSALTGANGFLNWTLNTNATASIAFSELFSGCTAFNGDISTWNTSRVYLMDGMFRAAASFNQNIGNWNVSNVINMNGTFIGASIFNQSLNSWDVSKVKNMANMLRSTSYNQPLNWGAKTGNVTSMSGMFFGNTAFNQDVNGWDVSKVTNMYQMFYRATAFNQNLNSWNVSIVINFVQMFANATAFNGNISSWQFTTDVTKNIDMASMLRATTVFNQDISGWNVSRATNMSNIFVSTRNFSQDLSSWDVSNVTNMRYMFHDCNFNAPLNWGAKTAKVTDMLGMFRGPSNFNQDISGWDVSSVTTMSEMFLNTSSFNQNLNTWDVSKVIDFEQMFYNASLFNGDISSWQFTTDVTKNISMASMFRDAPAFNQDLSNWNVSRVNQMQGMFQNSAFNQDMSAWDISNVSNLQLFLNGGQLSRANYNALLVGWSTLDSGETSIPSNLNGDFGSSTYSNQPAVITARDTDLIASKNWTITDAGMFDSTVFTPTTITGTTTICAGDSTTLTASGGTTNANTVDVWYEGTCGGEAYHEGWDTAPTGGLRNTTVNSVSNGILNVTSYSSDPMIEMYSIGSFNPSVYKYINIRYRVVSGTAGVTQIFFTNNTYTTENSAAYLNRSLVSDGNWHTQSIDMSTHANWATGGNITGWRYDFATVSGVTMELDFIELSSQPILGTGNTITVSPTSNTTYYVNRKGSETNTSCISQLVTVNKIPTISNFNNYSKTYFDGSFTIANPTSDSAGSFSYTSDNASVATISGSTVTITGIGTANITAIQTADANYCSNSIATILAVSGVNVLTKNGTISNTDPTYVDKYGRQGGATGLSTNGILLQAKTPVPLQNSLRIDAASSQYLTFTKPSSLNATGDFTFETWINFNTIQAGTMDPIFGGGQGDYISLYSGWLNMRINVNNPCIADRQLFNNSNLTTGTWHHIAVVRSGSTITAYLDGVATGNTTSCTGTFMNSLSTVYIGKNTWRSGYLNASISNMRYVVGTAVYTANFTPPTSVLTAISGTQFLFLANDVNFPLKDSGPNNITVNSIGGSTLTLGNGPF
jgi:surface protein